MSIIKWLSQTLHDYRNHIMVVLNVFEAFVQLGNFILRGGKTNEGRFLVKTNRFFWLKRENLGPYMKLHYFRAMFEIL